jgi:hypothetical protein
LRIFDSTKSCLFGKTAPNTIVKRFSWLISWSKCNYLQACHPWIVFSSSTNGRSVDGFLTTEKNPAFTELRFKWTSSNKTSFQKILHLRKFSAFNGSDFKKEIFLPKRLKKSFLCLTPDVIKSLRWTKNVVFYLAAWTLVFN